MCDGNTPCAMPMNVARIIALPHGCFHDNRSAGHSFNRITLECCKNAFAYRGPVLWNALPENIKKCESLNGFKQ